MMARFNFLLRISYDSFIGFVEYKYNCCSHFRNLHFFPEAAALAHCSHANPCSSGDCPSAAPVRCLDASSITSS